MKLLKNIRSLAALLALGLSFSACSGLTGGAAPGPAGVFNASQERVLSAGGGASPEQREEGAADPSGGSGAADDFPASAAGPGQPASAPGGSNPSTQTPMMAAGGVDIVASNTPLPGGFPAPDHMTPERHDFLEGPMTVCRISQDKMRVTFDGFARKMVDNWLPTDFDNGYTLWFSSKVLAEPVKAPLESRTVSTPDGEVTRTGYVHWSVDLPADAYPDWGLGFMLFPNDFTLTLPPSLAGREGGKMVLSGQAVEQIDVEPRKVQPIYSTQPAFWPSDASDIAPCPVTPIRKDLLKDLIVPDN